MFCHLLQLLLVSRVLHFISLKRKKYPGECFQQLICHDKPYLSAKGLLTQPVCVYTDVFLASLKAAQTWPEVISTKQGPPPSSSWACGRSSQEPR